MLKVFDYKCETCGFVKFNQMVNGKQEELHIDCWKDDGESTCVLKRQLSTCGFKIDVEAPKYIPKHVRRARNLGHDGATSKTEGSYD